MSGKKLLSILLMTIMLLALMPAAIAEEGSEPIQLHLVHAVSGYMLPVEENPIRDAIRETTGIDLYLEPWYYANEEEYRTRLNMWAASGDLQFDFFAGNGDSFAMSVFNSMGERGMLKNIQPYIEQSEPMMEFVSHTFPKYRDTYTGELYAYPNHLNAPEVFTARDVGISFRIDWMEEMGIEYPTSPEEFYELLTAVKEKHGVIPLTTNDGSALHMIGAQFLGLYGTDYWEKDAEGVYRIPMFENYDKTIEFGVYTNKLWREGLLDQEAFTQKSEQMVNKLTNSEAAGALSLRHSTQASINDVLWQTDEDALLAFMPSFPVEGVETAGITTLSNWGGHVIVTNESVSEEKMQAMIKYWEWVLSKEGTIMTFMGIEGEHYRVNEDGLCEFLPEFIEKYPTENERQEFGLWHYQSPACSWFRIDQYAVEKPEYARRDYSTSVANYNDKYVLTDVIYGAFPGEVEQLRLPSIKEAWEQVIVKAIMAGSEEECISILNDFLPTLSNLGYEDICQERTAIAKEME